MSTAVTAAPRAFNPARGEPAWVRWTLIVTALAFLLGFFVPTAGRRLCAGF
jgi:hypothetical protein